MNVNLKHTHTDAHFKKREYNKETKPPFDRSVGNVAALVEATLLDTPLLDLMRGNGFVRLTTNLPLTNAIKLTHVSAGVASYIQRELS